MLNFHLPLVVYRVEDILSLLAGLPIFEHCSRVLMTIWAVVPHVYFCTGCVHLAHRFEKTPFLKNRKNSQNHSFRGAERVHIETLKNKSHTWLLFLKIHEPPKRLIKNKKCRFIKWLFYSIYMTNSLKIECIFVWSSFKFSYQAMVLRVESQRNFEMNMS